MKTGLTRASLAATLLLTLSACGSFNVNLWPFGGGDKYQDRSKVPANSTAYQCGSGKRFYVRNLEDGAAVWLILPDREVRLGKTSASRYSNGITVLELSGDAASLSEGPNTLSGCKTVAAS
jgi:membrane-bound inhibitor of C-type lysozyme